MKVKPLGKRVLLSVATPEAKTVGIIMPESAPDQITKAEVHCVSDGVNEFIPGDIVLIDRYCGSEVNVDGKPYILMRAVDIFGIFTETSSLLEQQSEVPACDEI